MDYRMHTPPSIRCNDGLSMYPRAGAVTLTLRTNRPSAPGSIAVNFKKRSRTKGGLRIAMVG